MSAGSPSFLFINVARIGDTLLATPAMRAIATAHPGCRITALAHPKRAEVLRGLSFVARVGGITKNTAPWRRPPSRSEEHTSELQSQSNLVCRLLLEKKKTKKYKSFRHARVIYQHYNTVKNSSTPAVVS